MFTHRIRFIIFIVLPLLVVTVVNAGPVPNDRCFHVRQTHQKYMFKHEHHTQPISNICENNCCAGLETAIETKTRIHFSDNVLSHLQPFRERFQMIGNEVIERIRSIMEDAEQRVRDNYSSHIAKASGELIEAGRSILSGSRVDRLIDSHANNLLRAIIITELERTHTLEPKYLECVSSVNYVDIFGDTRHRLTRNISNAIETSRLILQSFQLASDVLSRVEKVKLSSDCVRHLANTLHCGHCMERVPIGTRPCRSVCRSVISNCISNTELRTIEDSLKMMSTSMNLLVDTVVVSHNPESIFEAYVDTIEKSIRQIEGERSNEMLKKTRMSCGPIQKRQHHQRKQVSARMVEYQNEQQPSYKQSFFNLLKSAAHMLEQNKHIFSNLEQKFCQNQSDDGCLDDRSSTSLNQAIALPLVNHTVNDGDQFYDRVNRFHTSIEMITINRLKLNNSTMYNLESGSSLINSFPDGSGSGHYPDTEDDYDDNEDEGSGSERNDVVQPSLMPSTLDNEITFPNPFITSTEKPSDSFDTGNEIQTGSSSSSIRMEYVVILFSLLVTITFNNH